MVLDLPGVGGNLHDHPMAELDFTGSPELTAALAEASARSFVPEEQSLAKLRSSYCREAFDLHLAPVAAVQADSLLAGRVLLAVACMTPRSRGRLSLDSTDPERMPVIDHGYLSEPGAPTSRSSPTAWGRAREIAATAPLADLIGSEIGALRPDSRALPSRPGSAGRMVTTTTRSAPPAWAGPTIRRRSATPPGRVHGLDQLYVGDCALIPTIPRANTNIPAVVVGARVAHALLTGIGLEPERGQRVEPGRHGTGLAEIGVVGLWRAVEVGARGGGEPATGGEAGQLLAQLGVVLGPVGLDAAEAGGDQPVDVVGERVRRQLEVCRMCEHRGAPRAPRSARRPPPASGRATGT